MLRAEEMFAWMTLPRSPALDIPTLYLSEEIARDGGDQ